MLRSAPRPPQRGLRALALLLLALGAAGCSAHDRCSRATEVTPRLCPAALPDIRAVRVLENASQSPAQAEPGASCAAFDVDEHVARRFLELARATNANDAHHTLDHSPCQAAGEVEFENGQTGRWALSRARSGTLVVGGREPLVLYCPACDFAPFQ